MILGELAKEIGGEFAMGETSSYLERTKNLARIRSRIERLDHRLLDSLVIISLAFL